MKLIVTLRLTLALAVLSSTACVDRDSDSSSTVSNASTLVHDASFGAPKGAVEEIQIVGAGIEGPLAFADAKIFLLDPSIQNLYDSNSPVSSAITNASAQIVGLSIPTNIASPPYILTIGGNHAIDLNTGEAPVISTLITVITEDMLASDQPIYSTPLTTMAFQMARHAVNSSADASDFIEQLKNASSQVSDLFAIDQNIDIDVFRSPLMINENTTTLSAQEEAVHHRAAIEAFAARMHTLSLSLDNISPDTLIASLARDLQTDGVIDNNAGDLIIADIDTMIFDQDPLQLLIPNTSYRVEDIVTLMEQERTLTGTDKGTPFHVDRITLPIAHQHLAETNPTIEHDPVITVDSVGTPIVTLSAVRMNFGNHDIGAISDPSPLTLTNSGTTALTISEISISSNFVETNNCNSYLAEGDSCTISVSFVPTSTGKSKGELNIAGPTAADSHRVELSGIGNSINISVLESSISNNTRGLDSSTVLDVDFNNHPGGNYTEQDAIDDFDADQSTGPGWSHHTEDTDIVLDPAGDPARGNVMRVTHFGGKSAGGPRFKGRLPVADEYYMSFDLFIPKMNELVMTEKLPGMIYGSMLNAGHAYGVKPVPEGVKAFLARITLKKPGTYAARGNVNQLTTYIYDADRVQYNRWFNLVDPIKSPNEGTYGLPKGQWVSIELRVKQNTAGPQEGVGDRHDGILQTWVDGQLAIDRQDVHWRTVNTMHIDGLSMYNFYGGPEGPENEPPQTQYTYFDNFIVSTKPITH